MEPQAIHGEAIAGQQAKSIALRKRMLLLSTDLTKNTFDLAEAFLEAQESGCYLEWGFDSLGDYASLELGIKHRKAQYLARIVKVCRECGVSRKDYEPVGITKLREITTLNPGDSFYNAEDKKSEPMVEHIVRLIAEAPENSTVELEQEIARLKGQPNTRPTARLPLATVSASSQRSNRASRAKTPRPQGAERQGRCCMSIGPPRSPFSS